MTTIAPEAKRDLILSVGMHQRVRPLSPIGVAELLAKMVASGKTRREISDDVMLDSTMIARFLRLLNLAPEIQHLVGWQAESQISFSTASEIARLRATDEHTFLVKCTLEYGLSKQEVAQIVEVKNKFGKPIHQCVEEIMRMRPKTVKRYLFVGAIVSAEVQNRLSKLSKEERDALFNKAITSSCPDLPYWEGRLGMKGFSLIGNEELNQALSKLPTDLESTINRYLQRSALGNEQSAS